MSYHVPFPVITALDTLERNGFEGWLVGGCVRDILLEREPSDWDIATSAMPEQVKLCFSGQRVIDTGLKHGTVTVLIDGIPVEITTYRVDGEYSDHRRPDEVRFTSSLRDDLSRRDFCVNAMAYHPERGISDPFGGRADLEARRIRCAGDPATRFGEDALRILRAARFAAVLGFTVEEDTAAAMEKLAPELRHVSAERVCAELSKAAVGPAFADALLAHRHVFAQILPELAPAFGFAQHSRYHHLDVFGHTVEAVRSSPQDLTVRMVMLLHDIGKPQTFTLDKRGNGHFYGHEAASAELADQALARLRFDNATRKTVTGLIRVHDVQLKPVEALLRRKLNRMGGEMFRSLLAVQRADTLAHAPEYRAERIENLNRVSELFEQILLEKHAFSLADLAVNGDDLLDMGYKPDRQLGLALNNLLDLVIDGKLPNEREELLGRSEQWKGEKLP